MQDGLIAKEIVLRGLSSTYLEAGPREESPSILFFLHGYPDRAEAWQNQIKFFADRFQVIAPYARGVRPSQPSLTRRRYSPESQLLDQLQILKDIDPKGQKKVFIVGHDIGALHAWNLAGHLKDRCGGLVIVNGLSLSQIASRLSSPTQLKRSAYVFVFGAPIIGDALARFFPGQILQGAYRLGKLTPALRPSVKENLPAVGQAMKQYREILKAAFKKSLQPWLPEQRIDVPVLILHGSDDPILDPPQLSELRRICHRPEIRIIQGGHWLHQEAPEQVNELLETFFHNHGVSKNA